MAAFAPDVIAQIGPLPITNTLITTLLVDAVLISGALYLSKNLSSTPKSIQSIIEPLIEGFYSLTESITSSKKAAARIFPYIMTFFIFILISNFMGLMPGVGSIGFYDKAESHAKAVSAVHAETSDNELKQDSNNQSHAALTPLFRGATSDINVTLALAIISVIATHMLSIQLTGAKDYLGRFFSLNPINLYVGLLELVAEFTKIISLSFRLFGNIYAGEVALHTISNLAAFLAPLPFLMLESIVSIIQALVFSILTLVFMAVLTKPHHVHQENGH